MQCKGVNICASSKYLFFVLIMDLCCNQKHLAPSKHYACCIQSNGKKPSKINLNFRLWNWKSPRGVNPYARHCNFNWNEVYFLYLHCSEEAEALAKRLKLRFYRASVKEDLNVNEGENVENWLISKADRVIQMKWSQSGFCISTDIAFNLDLFLVFKYLAEKYLQRLKQKTAEEPEVVHTTSNKIGNVLFCLSPLLSSFQKIFPTRVTWY